MLIRSIGSAGGAIGTFYYFGMSSLMAVEVYGAAQGAELLIRYHYGTTDLDPAFSGLHGKLGAYWDRVILCFSFLILLLLARLLTQRRVRLILSSLVLIIFLLSLAACCAGILTSLTGKWFPHDLELELVPAYPPPSLQTLASNLLLPRPVTFEQFRRVLSIVYPSFIGIFQGANLVSKWLLPAMIELINPSK